VFAQAIHTVHADLSQRTPFDAAEVAATYFPDYPLTIVPLACVMSSAAEKAILLATNIGGDSDSVASIAGSILGARSPTRSTTNGIRSSNGNNHLLIALADDLSAIRR